MLMQADRQWRLGQTGITTSLLAFGCARLGSALAPLDQGAGVALLRQAYDLGIRHFDTASIYGQGDSERWLGAALAGERAQLCLSSKAGQLLTPRQALLAQFKPVVRWLAARGRGIRRRVAQARAQGVPRCFEPGFIERSLHQSLARLRTDHLDIFYLHSPAPEVLDDAALFERLQRLQRQGLFRVLGVSCDELALARRAARHAQVQVVQFEFDGGEEASALVETLARDGKAVVLRGPARWRTTGSGDAAMLEGMRQMLDLPALGGLLMGTTQAAHLQQNVAVFQHALGLQRFA